MRDLFAAVDDLLFETLRGTHRLHVMANRVSRSDLPRNRNDLTRRLNLGASERRLTGYINVDSRPESGPDIVGDVRTLPFAADGEFDVIRASHVLEHFEYPEMAGVLAEWRRALRPGGYLVVCVPNNRALAWRTILRPRGLRLDDATYANGWIEGTFALQLDPSMRHKAVFDRKSLTGLLQANGFDVLRRISPWSSPARAEGIVDDSMSALSLNLLARRREVTPQP